MSLAWAAYRVLAPCLGAMAPAAGVLTSPQERPLWRERMGAVSLPGGCHAWIHAASLGEAAAVPPLVRDLGSVQPGMRLWLTATTRTGRERLRTGGLPVSLAPIDAPQSTRRFLRGVQPERILLIETELWPHWLIEARRSGIPVAIVSARLSDRSVGRYLRLGSGLRELVASLAAVLCQGEADARRWLAIGANPARTVVVGNLKSDGLPLPAGDRAAERAALGLDPARPVLVLGSLRPGEAGALARAWGQLDAATRERWQVVAVPRHPRASDELANEAASGGVRLSRDAAEPGAWRWDDRTGVLVAWYRVADVAFVGGSVSRFGGHNPLEPAACGVPVLMGPYHASQAEYVRALAAAGGIRIAADAADLVRALSDWLGDEPARATAGESARRVAESHRGASRRAVERLVEFGLWPV